MMAVFRRAMEVFNLSQVGKQNVRQQLLKTGRASIHMAINESIAKGEVSVLLKGQNWLNDEHVRNMIFEDLAAEEYDFVYSGDNIRIGWDKGISAPSPEELQVLAEKYNKFSLAFSKKKYLKEVYVRMRSAAQEGKNSAFFFSRDGWVRDKQISEFIISELRRLRFRVDNSVDLCSVHVRWSKDDKVEELLMGEES